MKHQDGLEKLRILLKSTAGVTTDMWMSHTMEGYITMKAHFIAKNWTHAALISYLNC